MRQKPSEGIAHGALIPCLRLKRFGRDSDWLAQAITSDEREDANMTQSALPLAQGEMRPGELMR
jgi:hypothetical protein